MISAAVIRLRAGREQTDCSFFSMSLVQFGVATAMTGCLSCHSFKYSLLQLQTESILVSICIESPS